MLTAENKRSTLPATLEPLIGEPDAGVIEEARERQRRWRLGALLASGILALGVGGTLLAGGGGRGKITPLGAGRTPASAAARRAGHAHCTAVFGAATHRAPSKALTSILAVLRRPPTPGDRLPPGTGQTGIPFAGSIRRTRQIGATSYFVYPALTGCRPGHVGLQNIATHVDLGHGLIGGEGGGGSSAASIEAGEAVTTGSPGSPTSSTITMIVPDGVASVTLSYPAGRASGYSQRVSPPFTITAAPVQNELVVRVPRSAGGGPIWKPTMTWRGHGGRVLRTFDRL